MNNDNKMITIKKPLKDLKLKEPMEIIYAYINYNTETIDIFYNDEIKLPLNLHKIIQKEIPYKMSSKKMLNYINDIKVKYIAKKDADNIYFDVYLK